MTISTQAKRGNDRGFTLIELLVVIAIIGILSSVVLASLNTARNKGSDAAIKADLANTRSEAELFYDTGSTYDGVCALTGSSVIGDQVAAAEVVYDGSATTYADATASTGVTGQCHDSAGAWAAWVPLKGSTASAISGYCVDSTGAAKTTSTVLAGSGTTQYACP